MGTPRIVSQVRAGLRTSLLRNSFFLLVRTFANSGMGFLFWLIVARSYTSGEMGVAAALLSTVLLLARAAALGLPTGILRFLPAEADKTGLINGAFTVSIVSAMGFGVVFFAGLEVWAPQLGFLRSDAVLVAALLASLLFFTLDGIVDNAFVAARHADYGLIRTSIFYGLRLPLALLFAALGVLGIVFAWTVSLVISVLGAALLLPRFFPGYRPGIALAPIRRTGMIRFSLWNYATGLVTAASSLLLPLLILVRMDQQGPETSAHFYAAYAIATLLYAIPHAFSTQLLVEGSHTEVSFVREKRRTLRYSGPLLAAGMAGAILLGQPLLALFGSEYETRSYETLVLLVLASPIILATGIFSADLTVRKRMGPIFALTSAGTLVTILVAWIAMPTLGIQGVAVGVVSGQTAKLLLYFSGSRKVRGRAKGAESPAESTSLDRVT